MDELNGRRYRREVKDEGNQDDDMNGNGSTVPTAPSSDEQQIEKQEKLPFTNGDQNRESERVSPTAPPPSYQSIDSGSTQKH